MNAQAPEITKIVDPPAPIRSGFELIDIKELHRDRVAARLRMLIEIEGVTLTAFAEKAGVAPHRLSNAVNKNVARITPDDAALIANAYGLTIDYIFGNKIVGLSRPWRDAIEAFESAQTGKGAEK